MKFIALKDVLQLIDEPWNEDVNEHMCCVFIISWNFH